MAKIGKTIEETIEKVQNGKMPLDTAEASHKLFYDHNMDIYSNDKEARRVGNEKLREELKKTTEKIKKI